MNPPPLLEVENCSCGYTTKSVLECVSFQIEAQEVVALLGCNGSGKSTLLKTLARIHNPQSGTIRMQGADISTEATSTTAKRAAFVPQIEDHVFGYTVIEVVAMGRIPWSDGLFETHADWNIVDESMRIADCENLRDRSILELSGGEKQRVLIARALAQQSKILLLDEPTSHLDVLHQFEVGNLLSNLARDDRAIIVAVHDLNWAAAFTKRALLLDDAKVVYDGRTDQLFESELLDDVYRIKFDRYRVDSKIRVFPRDYFRPELS